MTDQQIIKEMKNLRVRTTLIDDAQKLLASKGVVEGTTVFPKIQRQGPANKIQIQTNLFEIDMNKKVPVFNYRVEGHFEFGRGSYEFTRPQKEDCCNVVNAKQARKAMILLRQVFPELPAADRTYYDGGNLLFTLDQIAGGVPQHTVHVTHEEVPQIELVRPGARGIQLKFIKTDRTLMLGDLNRTPESRFESNEELRPLIQALEIATSEHTVQQERLVVFRNGLAIMNDPLAHSYTVGDLEGMPDNTYLGMGCKKSARVITCKTAVQVMKGSEEKIKTALVIDSKAVAFHQCKLVSEKVLNEIPRIAAGVNGGLQAVSDLLIGIYVSPIHRAGGGRMLRIDSVCPKNASEMMFKEKEENEISVADYFVKRYKLCLQHPLLPLITVKNRNRYEYYPMEVCEICPDQRMAKNHITPEIQSRVLTASTRLPNVLKRDILNNILSLGLNQSQPLSEAGLKVHTEPIVVSGREISPPEMQYNQQISKYDWAKCNWRSSKYFAPAIIKRWAIYGIERLTEGGRGSPLTIEQLKLFGKAFFNLCRAKGMEMPEPGYCQLLEVPRNGGEIKRMSEIFENMMKANCEFILVLTNKPDTSIHGTLKYCERLYQIVTQNVTVEVARRAVGINEDRPQVVTMENIVNKTNVKNGGLNYILNAESSKKKLGEDDLYIGISSNVSGGGFISTNEKAPPTVVGYAATDIRMPSGYTGNYVFQEPLRDEKLKVIEQIVETVLGRYRENRGSDPKRVFIFRNSCSEGSYDLIMKYEIPLVKRVLKNTNAKLIFIVVTKLHSIRLMPDPVRLGKPIEQNLKPGTVVDQGITNPYAPEFFLLGHVGRLGTAKVPRYTILCNDSGMAMEDIQLQCFHLCFGHQIITGMTSFPSPVFIADQMAKRGRLIYNTASTTDHLGNLSSHDYNTMTEELSYAKRLRDLRFNA